jgi:hypothetical protein
MIGYLPNYGGVPCHQTFRRIHRRALPGFFVAFLVIAGIVVVVGIGVGIWKSSVLRSGGLNPFVAREQLEARLAQSQMMQPPAPPVQPQPTKEQRLAEVDDLYHRGVISADEHATGRAKIIASG